MLLDGSNESGADVAREAYLKRRAPLGEQAENSRIIGGGKAVADAFGAEQFDRLAHALRSRTLAGMGDHVQAQFARLAKDVNEKFCGPAFLISSDPERHDAVLLEDSCPA